MAIYSWMGLPVQIHMTDENAAAYNRVARTLMATPAPANPVDFQFVAQPADVEVWNKVSDIINGMIELNGGLAYSEEETDGTNLLTKISDSGS